MDVFFDKNSSAKDPFTTKLEKRTQILFLLVMEESGKKERVRIHSMHQENEKDDQDKMFKSSARFKKVEESEKVLGE